MVLVRNVLYVRSHLNRTKKHKKELKNEVDRLEAPYHRKRYHIVKSLVLVEPGGGGGMMGMSYDKMTIVPYKVAIYYHCK